jgi:hypothetical protein
LLISVEKNSVRTDFWRNSICTLAPSIHWNSKLISSPAFYSGEINETKKIEQIGKIGFYKFCIQQIIVQIAQNTDTSLLPFS